jgi:hypothetical protein
MANTLLAAQKYAGMIQVKLYNSYLMKELVNYKFDDAFIGVDTVNFERQNDIVIGTLANYNAPITAQNLVQTNEIFTLSEIRYFAVNINIAEDIETHISPEIDMTNSATQKFLEEYETKVFKEYVSAGYTTVWSGATAVTAANIYEKIIALGTQMNINKIPASNRKLILNPTLYGMLQERLTISSTAGIVSTDSASQLISSGVLPDISGFMVYRSNFLQNVAGVTHALAFQGKPICFAANIRPAMYHSTVAENMQGFWRMVKATTKFGVHTFNEGAIRMIDVQVS